METLLRIFATVEARMTSSRLPGKVVLPALEIPMLSHLFRRLQAVPSLAGIVLATTTNASDDVLVDIAQAHGVLVHRGGEEDVLGRVVDAAVSVGAEVIVGITADCPIIDPDLIEQTIRVFLANDVDYASNSLISSYPDGMDTSVARVPAMIAAAAEATRPDEREHTFRFIVTRPERFRQIALVAPPSLHWPGLGLTLDEEADYVVIRTLIEKLGEMDPLFSCGSAIEYLREHPELQEVNRQVHRRSTDVT